MLSARFGDATFPLWCAGDGRGGGRGLPNTPEHPKSLRAPALMLFSTLSPALLPPITACSHPPWPLPTPATAGGGIFHAAGEWQPLFFSPVGDAGGDARAGGDLSGWSLAKTQNPSGPDRQQWGNRGLLHHAGSVAAASVSPCASRPALLRRSKPPQSWGYTTPVPGDPRAGTLCQWQGSLSLPIFCSEEGASGDRCLATPSARTPWLKPSPRTVGSHPRGRLSPLLAGMSCSQTSYWPNWDPLAIVKSLLRMQQAEELSVQARHLPPAPRGSINPPVSCANPAPKAPVIPRDPRARTTSSATCTPSLRLQAVGGDPCAPQYAFKPLACPPASSSPLPKGFAVVGSLRRWISAQQTAPLPLQRGAEQRRQKATGTVLGGPHLLAPAGHGHPKGVPTGATSRIPASIRRDGE